MLINWNAADAASLHERLTGLVKPNRAEECGRDSNADRLAAQWRRLVASDRHEGWAQRLEQLGWAGDDVSPLLGRMEAASDRVPWDSEVWALLRDADSAAEATHSQERLDTSTARVPFGALLVPLAKAAARRVRAQAGANNCRLSERAWAQVEMQILRRLADASEPTLTLEFAVFRAHQRGALHRLITLATNPNSEALYRAFVGQGLDRISDVVRKYPALARSWTQLVEDWAEMTHELVERLHTDGDPLASFLSIDGSLPVVKSIHTDLSDRHHGGRTVALLTFEGGAEVIYKPRNIDIEARWGALVRWLAERGAPVDVFALRVLPRERYGWVEVAKASACESEADFGMFYRRAGALLCLVHLLAGNDCHRENLIAVGDRPVLVDMETLMHPGMAVDPEQDDDAHAVLGRRLHHSVLGTAMLPHWTPMPTGGGYESGGIGPGGAVATNVQGLILHAGNTDEATLVPRTITLAPADNVPHVAGQYASADDYREQIVAGFEAMARFVCQVRPQLLEAGGPISAFKGAKIRVLLRGTPAYDNIRSHSKRAVAMRSGAARSIAIDSLARPLLVPGADQEATAAAWTMVEQERRALERLDIPRFEVPVERSAAAWRVYWDRSGLELCCHRISTLDEEELARQVYLIRASFEARETVAAPSAAPSVAPPPACGATSLPLATDAEIRRSAETIVSRIEELATLGAGDTATWMTVDVIEASRAYKLRPMGPSLYSGTAGVGLFLAAASAIIDDPRAARLARASVRQIRDAIAEGRPSGLAIGGVMGSTSSAYALAWMGHLLGDDSLVRDAARALLQLEDSAIERDTHYDVAGGGAGAILVLLAVHSLRPDDALVERALRCGEHLLAHRSGQPATWPTPNGSRLAGLAHGASGIALALQQLTHRTGESKFAVAALEALEWERTLFHPHAGNWQDARPDVPGPGPSFMNSWCNGACGIGMVRLHQRERGRQRAELAVAVETSMQHGLGGLDHLCCGNVGRAELLLDAGRIVGDETALEQSRRIFTAMLSRAERRGQWALAQRMHEASEQPGLFRGLAGIGWHGLRHLAPDRLPAIGVLEGARCR